jgi:hypothetical protein
VDLFTIRPQNILKVKHRLLTYLVSCCRIITSFMILFIWHPSKFCSSQNILIKTSLCASASWCIIWTKSKLKVTAVVCCEFNSDCDGWILLVTTYNYTLSIFSACFVWSRLLEWKYKDKLRSMTFLIKVTVEKTLTPYYELTLTNVLVRKWVVN